MSAAKDRADLPCPECEGSGMIDTSGYGDLATCDECAGLGKASAAPPSAPIPMSDEREALQQTILAHDSSCQARSNLLLAIGRINAPPGATKFSFPIDPRINSEFTASYEAEEKLESAIEALRAILASQPAVAVPQSNRSEIFSLLNLPPGWVLVPIEPTEEMCFAALDCQDHDPEDPPESEMYCLYKAMLEAAPTPPAAP